MCLCDQFQWDVMNPENDPDEFAWSLCSELGLGSDFAVAVSHSIREQLNEQATALLEGKVYSEALVTRTTALRPTSELQNGQWCPRLSEASAGSVQRLNRVSFRTEGAASTQAQQILHADPKAVAAVGQELKSHKLSQVTLSNELGVPQPYVSNWLSGRMPMGSSMSSMTNKMRQWLTQRGAPILNPKLNPNLYMRLVIQRGTPILMSSIVV